ncbi:hypothetical protein PybrP1_000243 [[Pythium] brassicae (nom. inval.)]|nr:hypothetical protein PybrP1_000243 [[Pythium] brassicae (nom. inval.)]
MKPLVCAALLSLLLLTRPQASASVAVELNDALTRSYADSATPSLSFAGTTEPLPAGILMTVAGYYGAGSAAIDCAVADTKRERRGKSVTVLLLLSKCLNDTSLRLIDGWIADMKAKEYTFLQGGVASPIEFAATLLSGQCQERTKPTAGGPPYPSTSDVLESSLTERLLLSEEVLDEDLVRAARFLSSFSRSDRVLAGLPDPTSGEESERTIAVVSFVNNAKSYDEVELFERKFKVTKAFNFQLCEDGESACDRPYKNAIPVRESADLVFYSPFTVMHTYSCPSLENGIPVSFVDAKQMRRCFCTCPAGFAIQSSDDGRKLCAKTECPGEPSCAWNTHPYGFKHEVTAALDTCAFDKIASAWGVPAPFPSDKSVGDGRTKSSKKGPWVKVSSSKLPSQAYDGARLLSLSSLGDVGLFERKVPPPGVIDLLDMLAMGDVTEYLSVPEPVVAMSADDGSNQNEREYTWAFYQRHRHDVVDSLAFSAYGKYALSLSAKGDAQNATCTGCLAIVDKFRPTATTACPARLVETDADGCVELTTATLLRADALVQSFFDFAEKATNDACSDNRCDENVRKTRDFFEPEFSAGKQSAAAQVKKAFKPATVRADLVAALKAQKNPLAKLNGPTRAKPDSSPVTSGACKRCVRLSTALREYWTDFTCRYEYDVQKCEGDAAQTCSLEQCLVADGKLLASATATLTASATKESKALGATAATEIRKPVGSQCTTVGGANTACTVQLKLSQVVDAAATANPTSVLGEDATSYVYWRYRVASAGEWKLWKGAASEDNETFKDAETQVFIEAWTACGVVAPRFTFTVVLVLPKPSVYASMLSAMKSSLVSASEGSVAGGAVATSLAACALAALVVVAVKRRRSRSQAAADRLDLEDAYLPLLE